MQVTYIGPHESVLIPDDSVPGGELIVEQGETVDLPAELANGLLEQGTDSADTPRHQPQWKKASKQKAGKAANSAAAADDKTAGEAEKDKTA